LSGRGTYIFGDGDRYHGQWRKDQIWGKGTYMTQSGHRLEGYWEKGQPVEHE
jgi:hypothetical protein